MSRLTPSHSRGARERQERRGREQEAQSSPAPGSPFSHVEIEKSVEGYRDWVLKHLQSASEALVKRGLEPI